MCESHTYSPGTHSSHPWTGELRLTSQVRSLGAGDFRREVDGGIKWGDGEILRGGENGRTLGGDWNDLRGSAGTLGPADTLVGQLVRSSRTDQSGWV